VDNIDTNINCIKTKMEEIAQNEKHENLVLKKEFFFFLDKFNSEIQDQLITRQGDNINGTLPQHENSDQVTDHNKSEHNHNLTSHEIDFRDETSTDDDNSFNGNDFWLVGCSIVRDLKPKLIYKFKKTTVTTLHDKTIREALEFLDTGNPRINRKSYFEYRKKLNENVSL